MGLGYQRATVITRTPVKHGEYQETPGGTWGGCSCQPLGSTERLAGGEITTSRWKFFAPPGFPTGSENVIDVEGVGRLHADGDLQAAVDALGRVNHVWGLLTRWEG